MDKVTSEQRSELDEEGAIVIFWGEEFQEKRTTNANTF